MIQYRYRIRNVKPHKRKDKFMKKVLSSILALVMLISTFAISSTSVYALGAKGTAITLNSTTAVTTDENGIVTVNFTPDADGYYEFSVDTKITDDTKAVSMEITDSSKASFQSDYLVYDGFAPKSEDYKNEKIAIAAKLKAGKTYNVEFGFINYKAPFNVNVTASKHSHTWTNDYVAASYTRFTFEGKVYSAKSNGYNYSFCAFCGAEVKGKEVYKPYCKIKLSKTTYTYDGKAKKPAITITNADGKKLDKSQYDVVYSNNKKVGYGEISILSSEKSDPRYSILAVYNFKILPKSTSIKSVSAAKKGFTVKYKKQATQTTGYQIQYATDKNFKKNKKTVTVKKNKTTSVKVKKLKAKKKYYVRVRTYKNVKDTDGNAKKLYSSWSKTKTVKTKK